MENVIKLPDRPVREWNVIEQALRRVMVKREYAPDMIDYVCMKMRPIYFKWGASNFDMHSSEVPPGELMKALEDWVQNLVTGLLIELAEREIELYQLRGNK
jgi:hypothetical protein